MADDVSKTFGVGDVLLYRGRRWECVREYETASIPMVSLETNDFTTYHRLVFDVERSAVWDWAVCTEAGKQGFALLVDWPSRKVNARDSVLGSSEVEHADRLVADAKQRLEQSIEAYAAAIAFRALVVK